MMTGEGGMITGSNSELLERCRLIINHGSPTRYLHTQLGFNYRMTSIAAALGLCQLTRLPAWNERRQQNAARAERRAWPIYPGFPCPSNGLAAPMSTTSTW